MSVRLVKGTLVARPAARPPKIFEHQELGREPETCSWSIRSRPTGSWSSRRSHREDPRPLPVRRGGRAGQARHAHGGRGAAGLPAVGHHEPRRRRDPVFCLGPSDEPGGGSRLEGGRGGEAGHPGGRHRPHPPRAGDPVVEEEQNRIRQNMQQLDRPAISTAATCRSSPSRKTGWRNSARRSPSSRTRSSRPAAASTRCFREVGE